MMNVKSFTRYCLLILFFIPLFSFSVLANTALDEVRVKLDTLLNDSSKYVGLSIFVLDNDESLKLNYGHEDLENRVLTDEKTLYELGSISKVFTRMLLASQDKIKFTDNISEYFPHWVRVPKPSGKEIKIKDLVTHMGVKFSLPCAIRSSSPHKPICFGVNLGESFRNPYSEVTREDNFNFLNEYSYTVEEFSQYFPAPGDFYSYSNFGIGLLGELVSLEYGASYSEILSEMILTPLEMNNTFVNNCVTIDQCKRQAKVYKKKLLKDEWKEVELWNFSALAGAGGVRSSIDDMEKFIKANLNSDTSNLERVIDIAQKKLEVETMNHNKNVCKPGEIPLRDLCNPQKKDLYYAWESIPNTSFLYHAGATGGSQSMVIFSKKEKVGVVVLSNSRIGEGDQSPQHFSNDLALCIVNILKKDLGVDYDFCKLL
ncbi:MAG: serine hydrolase [Bdellovibrionales bacterium]|nr:serine hydrolase [Bdellovibrionales bacterium]